MQEQRDAQKANIKPVKIPVVGDRVQVQFKVPDKGLEWFEGVVKKVNPATYTVLFDDGVTLYIKHHEAFLVF